MPIVPLTPKYTTIKKILPSTKLSPPRSLYVSLAITEGVSAPVPYGISPSANTLTPESSITRQVVLQGNTMPLTPGLHSSTGPLGN